MVTLSDGGVLVRIMDFQCGPTYLARYNDTYAGGRVEALPALDRALIMTYILKNRITRLRYPVIVFEKGPEEE